MFIVKPAALSCSYTLFPGPGLRQQVWWWGWDKGLSPWEEQWMLQVAIKKCWQCGGGDADVWGGNASFFFFYSLWLEQDCEYRGGAVGWDTWFFGSPGQEKWNSADTAWNAFAEFVWEGYTSLACSQLGVANSTWCSVVCLGHGHCPFPSPHLSSSPRPFEQCVYLIKKKEFLFMYVVPSWELGRAQGSLQPTQTDLFLAE